jgi:dethiobiotin synthase
VLEVGAGTGLLSQHVRGDLVLITDPEPRLLAVARARAPAGAVLAAARAEALPVAPGWDRVVGSMAAQWFADLPAAVAALAGLLAPGGLLALALPLAGSLAEWEGQGRRPFPSAEALWRLRPAGLPVALTEERLLVPYGSALAFLRHLRAIGADAPRPGQRPAGYAAIRHAMARFEAQGAAATWRIGTLTVRRPAGVFVTGTDTGIGKTLVSAALVRALSARYWKPVQTGLAVDPPDAGEVARLAGLPPSRVHPSAWALQAPLSPHAAAEKEGKRLDLQDFVLPAGEGLLVVEGAGGVLVPLTDTETLAGLMATLGLPAVIVARSTLGTVNHTLLSIEALRARGIPILGVVLNGPPAENRAAIEARGGVPVLAELPLLPRVDAAAVAALADRFAALRPVLEGGGG